MVVGESRFYTHVYSLVAGNVVSICTQLMITILNIVSRICLHEIMFKPNRNESGCVIRGPLNNCYSSIVGYYDRNWYCHTFRHKLIYSGSTALQPKVVKCSRTYVLTDSTFTSGFVFFHMCHLSFSVPEHRVLFL